MPLRRHEVRARITGNRAPPNESSHHGWRTFVLLSKKMTGFRPGHALSVNYHILRQLGAGLLLRVIILAAIVAALASFIAGISLGGYERQLHRISYAEDRVSNLATMIREEVDARARPGSPVPLRVAAQHLVITWRFELALQAIHDVAGAGEAEETLGTVRRAEARWWLIRVTGHVPKPSKPSSLLPASLRESIAALDKSMWEDAENRAQAGYLDPSLDGFEAIHDASELPAQVRKGRTGQLALVKSTTKTLTTWVAAAAGLSLLALAARRYRIVANRRLRIVKMANELSGRFPAGVVIRWRVIKAFGFILFSSSLLGLAAIGPISRLLLNSPYPEEISWWRKDAWLAMTMLVVVILVSLIPAGYLTWTHARKHLALAQIPLSLALDGRPPVLYLRAFGDDVSGEGLAGLRSTEEYFTAILRLDGPVIAIGRPGEKLPSLGARRLYVRDEYWHETVELLMRISRLVILRVGSSSGISWELDCALGLVRDSRLVLLVPSGSSGASARSRLGRELGLEFGEDSGGSQNREGGWVAGVVSFDETGRPLYQAVKKGGAGFLGFSRIGKSIRSAQPVLRLATPVASLLFFLDLALYVATPFLVAFTALRLWAFLTG